MSQPTSSVGTKTPAGIGGQYIDRGGPLPESYGETRIVLMPRDPHWMFAYWEITESLRQEVRQRHGEDIFVRSQPALRVHDVTDIQFNGSNSHRWFDVSISFEARNWYIKADESGRNYCVQVGLRLPDGSFIVLATSNTILLPVGRVSELTDEKWIMVKADFEKLLELSGADRVGMGSMEIAKLLAQRWELLQGISSLRGSAGISSLARAHEAQAGKKFWLVADTELILYGATEPTATVTVAGRPVELHPDGTFSLRFALPDGKLDLPVEAISEDRTDRRTLRFTVERKTV